MESKQLGSKFLERSQICSHTPSALNAGAKRSGATCHMAMLQCCDLAKGAKRPSHTTITIKFDRIPFDPCNSIQRFEHCPFDQKNSTYLQPPLHRLGSKGICNLPSLDIGKCFPISSASVQKERYRPKGTAKRKGTVQKERPKGKV